MPIGSGSLSCRCFHVAGTPPANFRDVYPLEIERHSFKPPQVDRGEMRSAGWVNPRRILDTHISLDQALLGERLILAIRVDAISLNSRIYKARLLEEMAKFRKDSGRERLSRDERNALEEKLQIAMARKQSPSTAIYEMAWNLKTREVIFTATGDRACMTFAEIFTETFGLAVEPRLPFLRAEKAAKKLNLQGELLASMPAILTPRLEKEPESAGEAETV
jgi:recombination associated protein RdgC